MKGVFSISISVINMENNSNTTPFTGRNIKFIVIHYTAGSHSGKGAARNVAAMFSDFRICASTDYIVDDEEIVRYNPDIANRCTWHCGGEKCSTLGGSLYGVCTNANSIGIEICSTNTNWQATDPANSPKWSFTDKAVSNAAALTKQLMNEYGIPAERVVRHYDVTGKLCPGIIGWNKDSGSDDKWLQFKKSLTAAPASTNRAAVKTPIYRVRTSPDSASSQIGAFTVLANAKKLADEHAGFSVYDMSGKLVYSPEKNKKSTAELAREVVAGKWGNGSIRRTRLINAGYDYNEVQRAVNELLS